MAHPKGPFYFPSNVCKYFFPGGLFLIKKLSVMGPYITLQKGFLSVRFLCLLALNKRGSDKPSPPERECRPACSAHTARGHEGSLAGELKRLERLNSPAEAEDLPAFNSHDENTSSAISLLGHFQQQTHRPPEGWTRAGGSTSAGTPFGRCGTGSIF